MLEQAGLAGTYYASLGLMKQTIATGEIFSPEDLPGLLAHGHELACHTYNHCPAWETSASAFEASVLENAKVLQQLMPGQKLQNHSYPISWPRPDTKRRVANYFATCRGGGQTFNCGRVDLNYLAAFFLEQSRHRPDVIKDVIDQNQRAGGWLIFATHDVCAQPTRYGVTPELFQEVVGWAAESGAQVLPVHQAWSVIRERSEQIA